MADKKTETEEILDAKLKKVLAEKDKISSSLQQMTKKIVEKSATSNEKLYRELLTLVKTQREQIEETKGISDEARRSQEVLEEIINSGISATPKEIKGLISRLDAYSKNIEGVLKDDELALVQKQLEETRKFMSKDYRERAALLAKTKKLFSEKLLEKTTNTLSIVTAMAGRSSLGGLAVKFVGDKIADRLRENQERKKEILERQKNDAILFKEELERIRQEKADEIKDLQDRKKERAEFARKEVEALKNQPQPQAATPVSEAPIFRKAAVPKGFVKYGFEDDGDMFALPSFNSDDDVEDTEFPEIRRVGKKETSGVSFDDTETAVQQIEGQNQISSKLDQFGDLLRIIVDNQKMQTRYLGDLVLSNDEMLERQQIEDFNRIENSREVQRVPSFENAKDPEGKKPGTFSKIASAMTSAAGGAASVLGDSATFIAGAATPTILGKLGGLLGKGAKFGKAAIGGVGSTVMKALPYAQMANLAYSLTGGEKSGKEYGTQSGSARAGNFLSAATLGLMGDGKDISKQIQLVRNGYKFDEAMEVRKVGIQKGRDVEELIKKQKKRLDDLRASGAKESVLLDEEKRLNDYEETLRRLEIENQKLFRTLLLQSGAVTNLDQAMKVADPKVEKSGGSWWPSLPTWLGGKTKEQKVIDEANNIATMTARENARRGVPGTAGTYNGPGVSRTSGGVSQYEDLIQKIAKEENVDPDLIRAMMTQESGGKNGAVSPKGATGLMQLMPATAAGLGVTDMKDPEQNIRGGARYMRQQLDKYNDVNLALAAYNAGPGAVDKYGSVPPYAETQDYVRKIGGNYRKVKEEQADKSAVMAQNIKELESAKTQSASASTNVGLKNTSSTSNSYSTNVVVGGLRNDESTYTQLELQSRSFAGM